MNNTHSKLRITCLIPTQYDFLAAAVIDGLNQLGHEFYCDQLTNNTNSGNYVPPDKILSHCNKSDFIFLFSNSGYESRKRVVTENNLCHKTIYIDSSDHNRLEDLKAVGLYPFIFKREIPIFSTSALAKIKSLKGIARTIVAWILASHFNFKPMPLAAEKGVFRCLKPELTKDIDVSCLLRERTNTGRKQTNEAINSLKLSSCVVGPITNGGPITECKDISKNTYYEILARSKISISYPGTGFDTGRFWEILANRCLLFSPPVQIKIPNPLIEYEHFIPYKNTQDLKEKIIYYLKHDHKREEISLRGYRHLMQYHTSRKRTEYLLKIISA